MHLRNGRLKLTAILVMWKPLQSEGIDRSSNVDATIGTERRRSFCLSRMRELSGIRQSTGHETGPYARLNSFPGRESTRRMKHLEVADLMMHV